jgi:hypothetical protein
MTIPLNFSCVSFLLLLTARAAGKRLQESSAIPDFPI